MPLLRIQTNININDESKKSLLQQSSKLAASELGKPESYVMVVIESSQPMLFGGTDAPLAYLELKSIGLPENKTSALSKSLCQLMQEQLHIPKDRVYIEFANADGSMWGWNGGTF